MTIPATIFKPLFWLACAGFTVLALVPTGYLPPNVFNWWDKAQHFLAFAVMGALGLAAYPKFPLRLLLWLPVFGGIIELAQAATGWRSGEWGDWFADTIGLAAAVAVFVALRWQRGITID